jgi:hypothetical protein
MMMPLHDRQTNASFDLIVDILSSLGYTLIMLLASL